MPRLTREQRDAFDALLEEIIAELPEALQEKLEEVPLVVEDYPSLELLDELGIDPQEDDLCGLHSGIPLTQRSVDHSGVLPEQIMIFREPIMAIAGTRNALGRKREELRHEIRVTLLHELGHHFGLDEDDLERLGYA